MMSLYHSVLAAHVACGIVGFVAFWTPAVARKGGAVHVRAGRVFFRATSLVALTGCAMATLLLIDPAAVKPPRGMPPTPEALAAYEGRVRLVSAFLFYLLLITFTPVYHGVRVLATRRNPTALRTPFHTALNVAAIAGSAGMVVLGIALNTPVFLFLSPIGALIGFGNLGFARKPYPTPMAWWYEHMGSMLGGGIAFHTAFLVLGAGRLFGVNLTGFTAVIPWILPTLIGVPATAIWTRHYRRKFKEARQRQAAA